MTEEDDKEKIKEAFIRLSKSIIDPEAEPKGEFDLGIEFSELDVLKFEEEQELNAITEEAIDKISKGLSFLEEFEE